MHAELIVANGSHHGDAIPIAQNPFVIGRSESSGLRIKSSSVSRKHCAIVAREGKFYVKDLGSRNGTLVNGQRLTDGKARRLRSGDTLQVGKIQLVMQISLPHTAMADGTTQTHAPGDTHPEVKSGKNSLALNGIDLSSWGDPEAEKRSHQDEERQRMAQQRAADQARTARPAEPRGGQADSNTNDANNSLGLSEEEERRRWLQAIRNHKSASSQVAASEAIRKMLGGGKR